MTLTGAVQPTFISLFSGIGGIDRGLELAGFECLAQVEIDPWRRKVLEHHWPAVARYEDVRTVGQDGEGRLSDNTPVVYALQGGGTTSQGSQGSGVKSDESFTLNKTDKHGIQSGATVRRLTPTECARLQAFPDDWCDIPGASDGKKYAAYGDSVTVNVLQWIGERIMRVGYE